MVILQGNPLNRSRIKTVVVVPLTSNTGWDAAPGNVSLPKELTGLSTDSVALLPQIVTVDRNQLTERTGTLPEWAIGLVLEGVDIVLDR